MLALRPRHRHAPQAQPLPCPGHAIDRSGSRVRARHIAAPDV